MSAWESGWLTQRRHGCWVRAVGLNKIVVNHLDKLFLTSDAATIMRELEVAHPAAKMLVLASQMQDNEVCCSGWLVWGIHVRLGRGRVCECVVMVMIIGTSKGKGGKQY